MNVRTLGAGLGFTEGPTITSDGQLIAVSIDQGRVYRIGPEGPICIATVRGGPNGATCDDDDVVYIAQNGGNWMRNPHPERIDPAMSGGVQRITPAGEVQWVSREPLAPNDICFGPDGWLYVTDPTRDRKYDDGRIWRCEPDTGRTELFAHVGWFCNGLAFGPDDQLYVASTGDRRIVRVGGDGAEQVVCQLDAHAPDGFAFDTDGNLLIGALSRTEAPGEIQAWSLDGRLIERIKPGDGRHYTNVALDARGLLIVTDSEGERVLLADRWHTPGLSLYPRRHHDRVAPELAAALTHEVGA